MQEAETRTAERTVPGLESIDGSPLWMVDWSDDEDADFRWAWDSAGLSVRVLRSRPTGPTVGRWSHRLHSWPAYATLAIRGLAESHGGPLVAWQPIAGDLAGLLRRRSHPSLTLLNPLFAGTARSQLERMVLKGAARADRIIFFSRRAVDQAVELGLDPRRVAFLPLGVRARESPISPSTGHLLAVGRDGRDWPTLAQAVTGLNVPVWAVGAPPSVDLGPLRRIPQVSQGSLRTLMAEATAVVVPLQRPDRTAGQLTVLLAMSVGRAVVATRTQGTEDYITPENGILVPPGDVAALRAAIANFADVDVARHMGQAALEHAQGPLALERFVADVDAQVGRRGP
jgi:glycosyltransferase involved in cell wall biosynthesis